MLNDKSPLNMESFTIRAYGLQELALLYFPFSAPASASCQLKRWINLNTALYNEIVEAGYHSGQRLLTPRQVTIITTHLGPP